MLSLLEFAPCWIAVFFVSFFLCCSSFLCLSPLFLFFSSSFLGVFALCSFSPSFSVSFIPFLYPCLPFPFSLLSATISLFLLSPSFLLFLSCFSVPLLLCFFPFPLCFFYYCLSSLLLLSSFCKLCIFSLRTAVLNLLFTSCDVISAPNLFS